MGTYYRWAKSQIAYAKTSVSLSTEYLGSYYYGTSYSFNSSTGLFTVTGGDGPLSNDMSLSEGQIGYFMIGSNLGNTMYSSNGARVVGLTLTSRTGQIYKYTSKATSGSFIEYVYSFDGSAFPNGGTSGGYYYNQRTTISSPVAPTSLTYPSPITTPSVTLSWPASVSNVPEYAVSTYEVSYATNGGSNWVVAGTTDSTSYIFSIPAGISSIQFRIRAQDTNSQWSGYTTGAVSNVILAPTLTAPSLAMQGQDITLNWTAVDGATSYTLQRQANTDDGWVQVYSGPNLTFTETVGTWTSVQYQVQAVFSGGAGGWATSPSIPVVSASALAISGTDEDLGTLTADVPYTVSTDTGNPITLTRTVNGNLVATLTVQSGFAYTIPVMDLPTGSGTIQISATVNATSGGTVSQTRTWTYTKTPITFPAGAGVGQLSQDGNNVFPATLAEAVKVPTNWGGTLDKALELLYEAANSAVISVGTYEGSGTYGADNPNTLTISPSPQVVTIYGAGQTLVISSTDTSSPAYIDGTTVKWYSTESAAAQMNTDGVTYSYVAVAKGVTA